MKLKVFTLVFDPEKGHFEDRNLVEYLANRPVISVFEHFFEYDGLPYWTIMVGHREEETDQRGGGRSTERTNWRAILPEPEQTTFEVLRRWRNERAKREGKPPYVLLTNRQLADVVREAPSTITDLSKIEGIGEARVKSFGAELLTVLTKVQESQSGNKPKTVTEDDSGSSATVRPVGEDGG